MCLFSEKARMVKNTYCTLGTLLCAEVFITVFMTSKTGKQLDVNEHHFLKI